MIDHITISVKDYETSKAFYLAALKSIGYSLLIEVEGFAGFGDANNYVGFGHSDNKGPIATLWLRQSDTLTKNTHIAFTAPDRHAVDKFYEAALALGAFDNGAPGLRAHYHPTYYAAFVLDPDGNNIEVVCHI